MPAVLVSHPHAATVASHVAAALDSRGWLAQYVTGIAAAEESSGAALLRMIGLFRGGVLNRMVAGVAGERIRTLWWGELASRASGLLASRGRRARRIYDSLFVVHDAALARLRWPPGLDAIYAYEDGAMRTFQRAHRMGVGRFWDSPAIPWQAAERIWQEESKRWPGAMGAHPPLEPEWKKRRKEEELELADVVFVASRFARGAFEGMGCRKPVVQVPYGFPVESFQPKVTRSGGPFTVLAVGVHDLRKGTPYLLEAWRRAGLREAKLRLVGPMKLSTAFLSRFQGLFEHVAYLPRVELEKEYRAADLLAFPTLGDGFGLVIQEAMCCATPVLTTLCGGGPDCISDNVDGWIVPAQDLDALVQRLRDGASDSQRLWRMGIAARRRAERYPWPVAEQQLAQSIAGMLSQRPRAIA